MASIENRKAAAWDRVGGLFWTHGRETARPTQAEIDIFLADLPAGARIVVAGASTKDLVEAALARGLDVSVLDFSERMCADLRQALGERPDIRVADITQAMPHDLVGVHDAVLSDRLINRFTREESVSALSGMLSLLRPGGTVRASIKMGLYPMDERMIEEGRRRGTLADFYDEATRTIDFQAARDVLEACLLPHGEIDRDILLEWYRGRGRESRFDDADIRELASRARAGGLVLAPPRASAFPNAKETNYYVFDAVARDAG